MENNKQFTPFKLIKVLGVDSNSERLGITYCTKAHPDDVFLAYVRPKCLERFGQEILIGGYYSAILDGEYVNYLSVPNTYSF